MILICINPHSFNPANLKTYRCMSIDMADYVNVITKCKNPYKLLEDIEII